MIIDSLEAMLAYPVQGMRGHTAYKGRFVAVGNSVTGITATKKLVISGMYLKHSNLRGRQLTVYSLHPNCQIDVAWALWCLGAIHDGIMSELLARQREERQLASRVDDQDQIKGAARRLGIGEAAIDAFVAKGKI